MSSTSHVILCVFFKKIEEGNVGKARTAQARIARLVYDHFANVNAM
jgi:hypothetical protein